MINVQSFPKLLNWISEKGKTARKIRIKNLIASRTTLPQELVDENDFFIQALRQHFNVKTLTDFHDIFEKRMKALNRSFNKEIYNSVQKDFLEGFQILLEKIPSSSEPPITINEKIISSVRRETALHLERQYNIQIKEKVIERAEIYLGHLIVQIKEPKNKVSFSPEKTEIFLKSNNFDKYNIEKNKHKESLEKIKDLKRKKESDESLLSLELEKISTKERESKIIDDELQLLESSILQQNNIVQKSRKKADNKKNSFEENKKTQKENALKSLEENDKILQLRKDLTKLKEEESYLSFKYRKIEETEASPVQVEHKLYKDGYRYYFASVPSNEADDIKLQREIDENNKTLESIDDSFSKIQEFMNNFFKETKDTIDILETEKAETVDREKISNLKINIKKIEDIIKDKKTSRLNSLMKSAKSLLRIVSHKPSQPDDEAIRATFHPESPTSSSVIQDTEALKMTWTLEELEEEVETLKEELSELEESSSIKGQNLQSLEKLKKENLDSAILIWRNPLKALISSFDVSDEILEKHKKTEESLLNIRNEDEEETLLEKQDLFQGIISLHDTIRKTIISDSDNKKIQYSDIKAGQLNEIKKLDEEIASISKQIDMGIQNIEEFKKHNRDMEEQIKKELESADSELEKEFSLLKNMNLRKLELQIHKISNIDNIRKIQTVIEDTESKINTIALSLITLEKSSTLSQKNIADLKRKCQSDLEKDPEAFVLSEKFHVTRNFIHKLKTTDSEHWENTYNAYIDGVEKKLGQHRNKILAWFDKHMPFISKMFPSTGTETVDSMNELTAKMIPDGVINDSSEVPRLPSVPGRSYTPIVSMR